MRKIAAILGAFATVATSVAAVPTFAVAQSRYDGDSRDYRESRDDRYDRDVERRRAYARRHNYRSNCYADRRSDGNKGTVAGALVGGASGALIGGDVLGGLVGAGVGAVAGHQIAKSRTRC